MGLQWNGPTVNAAITDAALAGLNRGAEHLRGATIPRTPLQRGDLRGSLTVVPADAVTMRAAVVTDSPYAVRQHEELGYRHPEGGEAKYLERTAHDEEDTIAGIIQKAIREAT